MAWRSRGWVAVMLLQCFSRGSVRIVSTGSDVMSTVHENMPSDPGDLAHMWYGVRQLAALYTSWRSVASPWWGTRVPHC